MSGTMAAVPTAMNREAVGTTGALSRDPKPSRFSTSDQRYVRKRSDVDRARSAPGRAPAPAGSSPPPPAAGEQGQQIAGRCTADSARGRRACSGTTPRRPDGGEGGRRRAGPAGQPGARVTSGRRAREQEGRRASASTSNAANGRSAARPGGRAPEVAAAPSGRRPRAGSARGRGSAGDVGEPLLLEVASVPYPAEGVDGLADESVSGLSFTSSRPNWSPPFAGVLELADDHAVVELGQR